MNNTLIFSISSNSFVIGWLALLVAIYFPTASSLRRRLLFWGGRVIPIALLCAFLIGVVASRAIEPKGNMFSFEGIVTLFSVPERLLNVWMEVMAYSLLVGRWIIDDATQRCISRWWVLPCHLVLFISGGLGLLAYLLVLAVYVKYRTSSTNHRPL